MHNSFSIRITIVIVSILFAFNAQSQQYLEFLQDETLTYKQKVELAEAHFEEKGRGKHTGYKQFERWRYFARRNVKSDGYVMTEQESIAEYENFKSKNNVGAQKSSGTWVEKGPLSATNTSTWSSHIGRLSNIGIDPNDDTHMIVTSLGGGAWKTTDEGANWTPIFDFENTMSLQSAMISHANADHYFIGTTGGIRRSTDGGATWTASSGVNGTIYTIIMDPTNANIILASSSNGRIYKSIDGGTTWTNELLAAGTNLYDLEWKPGNSNIVYAAGRYGRMYTSTDKGDSWTAITNGPWNTSRTIMMAVTPADANYIYVLQEQNGGYGGLYLSTDGGASWSTQSDDSTNDNNIMGYDKTKKGGQAPRDMDVIVSPTDKTEVHVAGVMTFKSSDSGVTWIQTTHWVLSNSLPFVHADIDQLIYHGSKIYVASDGGIFISDDQGASFDDKTTGLGIRQFYRISASTTDTARVAGGSQDNGTGVLRDGIWYDFMGADGMEPLILNNNEDVVIGSIQYGELNKSTNGGNSTTSISQTQNGDNGEWVTPLERDPAAANTIYQGKLQLYKSNNAGGSWQTISDITVGSGTNTKMDEICIAPSDNNTILVSYSDELYKTTDGGLSWSDITPPSSLSSNINYINVHPTDANRFVLATSGGSRFAETTDGGTTWTNITHNLPSSGSNSIVFNGRSDDGMYVSMSKGVYYKDNKAPTVWTLMDTGLPKVNVTELEIINDKLYAATYGRGLWELDIPGKGWELYANSSLLDCISQGTVDSLDDAFTFQLDPSGMGLGTNYSVLGDIVETNIPYGTPFVFDNSGDGYPKHNGSLNLTITDDTNPNATISIKINANISENCYNNSTCNDAFLITESSTILCAGPYIGEGATIAGRSASWYTFTPTQDGSVTIKSCGYGEDTNLYLHKGYCFSKTLVSNNDDGCSMGQGLSNYASQLIDIPVNRNETYFVEWDSRWSSDPFYFDIEFKTECTDIILANVTNSDTVIFHAQNYIDLDGTTTGIITAITEMANVNVDGLILENQAKLNIARKDCEVNSFDDILNIKGSNEAIPDNGKIDIDFVFPSSVMDTVTDLTIGLNVEHPAMGELKIELVSPDNASYVIWDNFCPDQENINVIYDHKAEYVELCTEIWQTGVAVFTEGSLSGNDLAAIYTQPIAGTWKIRLTDNSVGNTGIIKQLHLYLKGN